MTEITIVKVLDPLLAPRYLLFCILYFSDQKVQLKSYNFLKKLMVFLMY